MKFFHFSKVRTSRTIALLSLALSAGFTSLLARPDPPAADRLMDPTKPENQDLGHLFAPGSAPATPAAPTPSEQAFKNVKSGPATFAEFCQLHPLAGKPLGQDRLVIEVLATEVDATADAPTAPTAAMLSTGNLLRQPVFANSQAQTENVLMIDRQPDGTKLPEPAWEGTRLFTCLEQSDTGYTLAVTLAESQMMGWGQVSAANAGQPVINLREFDNKLPIAPNGQWVSIEGSAPDASDHNGTLPKQHAVIFIRLVKLN